MTTKHLVIKKVQELVPGLKTGMKSTRVNSQVMEVTADMPIELPIQLHHVLMGIAYNSEPDSPYWFVSDLGLFRSEEEIRKTSSLKGVYWNLSFPLDQQEPEVFEFLAEVLGVKE